MKMGRRICRCAGIMFAVALALALFGCRKESVSRINLLLGELQGGIDRGTLFMASEKLTDAELSAILADSRVSALTELTLHNNALTAVSARAIVTSPKLTAVKNLDLSFNPIGDDGVTALVDSPAIARLRRLSLAAVGATGRSIRALASSPHTANIAELDLGFQNMGEAAGLLLAPREKLSLQKAEINGATAVILLRKAQVRALTLNENLLGTISGLEEVSPSIVALDLTSCALTDISSLTRAAAPGLRQLNLDYNPIGDAGMTLLAQAQWLAQLQFLSVMGTKTSADGRKVLRASWGERPGLTIER